MNKSNFFAVLLLSCAFLLGMSALVSCGNGTKSKSTNEQNFQDDSEYHREIAKIRFINRLSKTNEYLVKNGTINEYSVALDPSTNEYEVRISYNVEKMGKMKTEILKGNVYLTDNELTTRCSMPVYINSMVDDTTGVIGKWKITVAKREAYEFIIKKEGSSYYGYEFGRKTKLKKKDDRYYVVGSKVGEYYQIVYGNLHLCDKDGDFTYGAGYDVDIIK